MQYKNKDLYEEILRQCPELGNAQYIEDYIKSVTEGIEQFSISPKNLILKIPHFGNFHWRYTKLFKDRNLKADFINETYKKSEKHSKFIEVADFVLDLYKVFKEKKVNIRKERFGDNYLEKKELEEYKLNRIKNSVYVDENGYKVLV